MVQRKIKYSGRSEPAVWWMRLLEQHGISTVVAFAFMYVLWQWGGRLIDSHLTFLAQQTLQMQAQTDQMKMQTSILKTIADSGHGTEQKLDELKEMLKTK